MKRTLIFLFILSISSVLFAQQKIALVIGNSRYTGISVLNNPENDANDMEAALRSLGFTVIKVLNGSRTQMETAVVNFKQRLRDSANTYGFFFYAGHGIQSNGENYLIPVDANIPSENALRDRAVSLQWILAELNDARNELNIVVLDSCRDNPFPWNRSGTRGLTVVNRAPPGSIIFYATSDGRPAADGTGRNGLFTSSLLNSLRTPDLEITEVIRQTGAAVLQASDGTQIPATYNQFFGTAYLGSRPSPSPVPSPSPTIDTAAARTRYDAGVTFLDRSEWDAAIREFDEAIRLDPNYAEAYAYRARANERKNNNDQAIIDANRAIQLNPQLAFAYFVRGTAYNKNRDNDRAIADLNEAIRLNPNFALAYNNRGNAYRNKNDNDRAIADYNEAIRLNPNFPTAYNNRGIAYQAKGDTTRADADFERARELRKMGYTP